MKYTIKAVRELPVNDGEYDNDNKVTVALSRDGKPLSDVMARKVRVQEIVNEWELPSFIGDWVKEHLLKGDMPFHETRTIMRSDCLKLLAVCEKVVNGCHMVLDRSFAAKLDSWPMPKAADLRLARRVVKNINLPHQLMPITDREYTYDQDYYDAVDSTRKSLLALFAYGLEEGFPDVTITARY